MPGTDVTVVETRQSGSSGSSPYAVLTFTTTPVAGDVVVLILDSWSYGERWEGSGMGGTWSSYRSGEDRGEGSNMSSTPHQHVLVGRGVTAAGVVTITDATTAFRGVATGYLLRGDGSFLSVLPRLAQDPTAATTHTLTAPRARAGDVVLASVVSAAATGVPALTASPALTTTHAAVDGGFADQQGGWRRVTGTEDVALTGTQSTATRAAIAAVLVTCDPGPQPAPEVFMLRHTNIDNANPGDFTVPMSAVEFLPTDVVVVVEAHYTGDTVPAALPDYTPSGLGAAWTEYRTTNGGGGPPVDVWVGRTPTTPGLVTLTKGVNTLRGVISVFLVRGLIETGAEAVAAGTKFSVASQASPSVNAKAAELVVGFGYADGASGAYTHPATEAPAGDWRTLQRGGDGGSYGLMFLTSRQVVADAAHQTSLATTSSASLTAGMLRLGVASAAPQSVTLSAATQRMTGAFALTQPVAPAALTLALAGTTQRPVGAFSIDAPANPASLSLAGTVQPTLGAFAVDSGTPAPTPDGPAVALAGVMPRPIATFIARVEIPVAPAPIVAAGGSMVVAQAFGPVTMQGTQPVYSISQAAAPRGRQRILVDGIDVTYFRGGILPNVPYALVSPLLYGPGSLEVPQVSACFERLGEGELSWLREGAAVEVHRVIDDVVVGVDYKGVIVAFDLSGRNLTVELGGEASGRAALRNRQVPIFPRINDIGHQIDDAVRDLGLPTLPHLGPVTGIETMTTGGTGHLEHIQNLVAKAFTKAGRQWTIMPDADGIYRTKRKDTTTVHATAFTDDARTVATLRRDVAEEPNRIFGAGVTPAGQRVRNGVYPGLIQGRPPAFPGPMQDGDTGEGVRLLIGRLQAVGYIGLRDVEGGYDDDVHDAVVELQTDAGFFDDGFGTTEPGWVDEKTWRALYDLDVTGASLEWAHIEPMAQRRKVRKWNRTGSGVPTKINPAYDAEALVVDRNIDFGAGLKRRQMFNRSLAELHDSDVPNWAGDITFHTGALIRGQKAVGAVITEADVMDARELKPGMNLWLPQFDGGTLVHVSACQVDREGIVTATVDTRFRDSMEVWEVIARNKESRRDPARNRDRQHRSSTIVKDSIGEWDEIGGLLGNDVDLEPGWNVVKVVGAAEGTISRLRLIVQTVTSDGGSIGVKPHEFACAVFGREIGPGTLSNLVPNPLTVEGSRAWEKRRDALDDHWLLYAAGTHDEPCGYSPGRKHWKSVTTEEPNPDYDPATDPDSAKVVSVTTQESWGVLTGKHVDDAGFAYRSDERTWLHVAVWVAKPTTLHAGRIMWPQLEAGV